LTSETANIKAQPSDVPRWLRPLLIAPSTLWFLFLLVLPLCVVIVYSFGVRAPTGGYQAAFTFANYANIPARLTAFKNTLMLAPVGTPDAIIRKVHADLRTALDDPEVRTKFAANGAFVRHMTPEEVTAFVQSEQTKWRPILEQVARETAK